MFRRSLLSCLLLFISSSMASSIVVIQGDHSAFGRKYFAGFSSLVREKIVAFQYEKKKERALIREIRSRRPDLIVTIGKVPVERLVTYLPSTPFIVGDYYSSRLSKKPNVVLMENSLPVEAAFDLGQKILGNKKKIGTIYDPKYSESAFQSLAKHATSKKVDVAAIKVDTPEDAASFINAFQGKVDMFLAIRDATTSTQTASDAMFSFASKNNICVISLDPNHRSKGALLTLSIDPIELGEQAWNVAKIILVDKKIPQLPEKIHTSELTMSLSMGVASKAGISNENIMNFLGAATQAGYNVRLVP